MADEKWLDLYLESLTLIEWILAIMWRGKDKDSGRYEWFKTKQNYQDS